MAFEKVRKDTAEKVLLGLMHEIENDAELTQRSLSKRLGVALGLTNQYLKHVITKGWVRVSQVSPRRILYFVTPQGFQEKSRMVTGYLKNSLSLYREARGECEGLVALFRQKNWRSVALVGEGDLADIATLVFASAGITTHHLPSVCELPATDVVLIADIHDPQGVYQRMYDQIHATDSRATIRCFKLLRIRPCASE